MAKIAPLPPIIDNARIGFVRNKTLAAPKKNKSAMMLIKAKSVFTLYSNFKIYLKFTGLERLK